MSINALNYDTNPFNKQTSIPFSSNQLDILQTFGKDAQDPFIQSQCKELCQIYQKYGKNLDDLTQHFTNQIGKGPQVKTQCPVCKQIFASKPSCNRHYNNIHKLDTSKLKTCPVCKKVLTSKYSLQRHHLTHKSSEHVESNDHDESSNNEQTPIFAKDNKSENLSDILSNDPIWKPIHGGGANTLDRSTLNQLCDKNTKLNLLYLYNSFQKAKQTQKEEKLLQLIKTWNRYYPTFEKDVQQEITNSTIMYSNDTKTKEIFNSYGSQKRYQQLLDAIQTVLKTYSTLCKEHISSPKKTFTQLLNQL